MANEYRPVLEQMAQAINIGGAGRPIGDLQKERSQRHRLQVIPSLIDGRTTKDHYAFHVGGQAELQFNIGFETVEGREMFKHGVAFSLQPNRNIPDIRVLIPKIRKFNEYLRLRPDDYSDLSMWHVSEGVRTHNYPPAPIPDGLLKANCFIFLGVSEPTSAVSVDRILDTFDRLKPLYDFIESESLFPTPPRRRSGFIWSPGSKARSPLLTITRTAQTLETVHQHNLLQDALYRHLEQLHGQECTSGEQPNGNGKPIDVAVRDGDGYLYYEVKTGLSARACIREGLGQLLEYSYWPGAQRARKLIIVGEATIDSEAKKYLAELRRAFALPIYYQQFDLTTSTLVGRPR